LNIQDAGFAPHSLNWNLDGSLLAACDKAKMLHIMDPRASENHVVQSTLCHESVKGARVVWMQKTGRIFTCGSSKIAERQFKIWDQRDLSKPIAEENIDSGSGQLMPFFDEDTQMMYLAGRGDGNIRFFEFVDEEPYYHFVDAFKSNTPQKGMGMIPKLGCNTSIHEVTRLLKLQSTDVVPLSFCVPRKSNLFQSDIYPKTLSSSVKTTIEEFLNGKNGEVEYISINPKDGEINSEEVEFKSTQEKKPKTDLPKVVSTPKDLALQNEEFRKRIEALETENWELKQKLKDLSGGEKKEEEKKEEEVKEEEVKEEVQETNE
jgi:coronin-1B/1C/6